MRRDEVVIDPTEPATTLEALADQITDENRHDEIETGGPVGNEFW